MTRPRGVTVYAMPEEVCGPFDRYALLIRGTEGRMVHTEGVAYAVTVDKPWRFNDYDPAAPVFTLAQLVTIALASTADNAVDLADWVRTFGARLESNFGLVYTWANLNQSEVQS